jgi:NOL1/NOP2/fmu family ribosome biogenesis protein
MLHAGSASYLSRKLRILSAGICLAEAKGKDIVPSHALAMSTAINREAFAAKELSWEESIRYLRKEAPLWTGGKGYVLVTCKGLPLGFVKQIGNRANNLYPGEWRIRKQQTPGEETDVVLPPGVVLCY